MEKPSAEILKPFAKSKKQFAKWESMKTFPLFDRKYVDYCWVNMSEYCDISLWWMELSQVPILDDSCEDLLK